MSRNLLRSLPALKPRLKIPFLDNGSGAVSTLASSGMGTVTFTRATEAACKLSTGLWKLDVASGTARSHYTGNNTAVGNYAGYLSELAATQLALNPRDMTQASWVKTTMTTAQTSTGIDGVSNSCTRLTAAGGNSMVLQTLVAAASSRTYSCFIKRVTGTGTINITQDGVAWTDITSQINATTFTLVQLNASVLNAVFGLRVVTDTDAIDVDCNQFEAGAVATTPIPAAGTRNADVMTFPSSANVAGSGGTVYAEISTLYSGNSLNSYIVDLNNASNNPALYLAASADALSMFDGTTASLDTVLVRGSSVSRVASHWGGARMKTFLNGAEGGGAAFDGDMGVGTNIGIGCGIISTVQMNGTVKNLRIFPKKLSVTEVKAIR